MPAKSSEAKSQQTLSSFFKPATQPPKRPAPEEVLILDSDDDDADVCSTAKTSSRTPAVASKKVKTEHDTRDSQLSPIASTSKLPASTAPSSVASKVNTQSKAPSASAKRIREFAYVEGQQRAPQAVQSDADKARHEAFVKRLSLGPNLLQKRNSYLQKEHHLAATGQGEDAYPVDRRGAEEAALSAVQDDDVEEEDGGDASSPDASSTGKGKGKAKEAAPSRFAKFAARGKAGSTNASGDTVNYTPLEKQVLALRKANPGVLLVIEVGYKFRFFDEDARVASRILNIACFPQQHMLTASIPTHRLDVHVKRLLNAGYKVGIVRQQETAALKKASANRSAPFTRALTALYTSATYVDELDSEPLAVPGSTATLMCVVEEVMGQSADAKVKVGLVSVAPSTGAVVYDEFEDGFMRAELETRLLHLQPSELLIQQDLSSKSSAIIKYLAGHAAAGVPDFETRIEELAKRPSRSQAATIVSNFYATKRGVKASKQVARDQPSEIVLSSSDEDAEEGEGKNSCRCLNGDGTDPLDLHKQVLVALASLIKHLQPFGLDRVFRHRSAFVPFASRAAMTLNGNTVANLELLHNNTDFKENGSLVSILDHCKTAMGKRQLRRWVTKPLLQKELVEARLQAISEVHRNSASLTLSRIRDLLRHLPDLERGLSRIHFGRATPSELYRVLEAFQRVGGVFEDVDSPDEAEDESGPTNGPLRQAAGGSLRSSLLLDVVKKLPKVRPVADSLLAQIDVKRARDNNKEHLQIDISKYPELEAAKEGLSEAQGGMQDELMAARKILRKPALQFTKVALEEYLLEVKISEAKNIVPADWIKINSTKAAYRYRSPALQKRLEILEQWQERVEAAANAAFLSFLQEVSSHYEAFRAAISALATADCVFSLARVALANNWVRPDIADEAGVVDIVDGRHPIIEEISPQPFVPNTVRFGGKHRKQMVLTGLNMGGKSSLSRSVALIALLAQIGSFVPAAECRISLFDSIFTRMGASDDVARGRSTFMVELTETSEILRLATARSLIILDELGRGTSTNDGQAIAAAVLEHLVTKQSTCIFVTHYPALALVAKKYPVSVSVNHMACLETPRDDGHADVTFLYRLADGLASASHGLNVARLAELPDRVIEVARVKGEELRRATEERTRQRQISRLADILRRTARLADSTSGETEPEEKERLLDLCEAALVR
ncbi:hypothetical protein JCM10908_004283 [Rhodotorula pacifica]|uniref:mismatch repair protein MSH3 n=1 Tax=Rhodotorula pacifica TaxID=1495444 RepID=UPI00316E1906